MDVDTLRNELRNGDWASDPFSMLRKIGILAASPEREEDARELLIRLLPERSKLARAQRSFLNSLLRQLGLYPYIEKPKDLGDREKLAYEFHRPLEMGDEIVLHEAQGRAYRALIEGRNVILSAPTSFGKSLLIDAMLALGTFDDVAVVVPTIALIDETRRRLQAYSDEYKIITHAQQEPAARNVFVMTQERFLSYEDLPCVDFFVIDEFYKLDPSSGEHRSYLLNQAFYKLQKQGAQFYMIGPNIRSVPADAESQFECTFIATNFQTVVTETEFVAPNPGRKEVVRDLLPKLDEQTIVYAKSPASARKLAQFLIDDGLAFNSEVDEAIQWLGKHFHPGWMFVEALNHGLGLHHGKLPRSIAQ